MKYYQRIDINGDKSRLPKETGYYFVKFKQKGDSKIYADTFASHYFGEGDNKDAIWLDCIEWYLQPCTDKRDELIEKSVPEISDEVIKEWAKHKARNFKEVFPEGLSDEDILIIGAQAIRDGIISKSELAKRMNNEVTMHDLRNDDLAREERKQYDCICKVCKSEFKSNIADFDICPSCYV
jgi:hypothetical protein